MTLGIIVGWQRLHFRPSYIGTHKGLFVLYNESRVMMDRIEIAILLSEHENDSGDARSLL